MPKLSFKERRNLYEKIRMDDQERKEWEEGLQVKITPDRRARIEQFPEIVRFIESGSPATRHSLGERQGIYNREVINQQAKAQNQRAEKMAICVKCGQWVKRKSGKTKNGLFYCGYCHAVCFGPVEKKWPATIAKNDKHGGLHKA